MSWRATVVATMASVAVFSACANDAQLLYDRDLGEGGGDVPPPLTGGFAGSGGDPSSGAFFPVGSGGDEPPPPELCPPPGQPFCECAAFDYCTCHPSPEEEHCTMFCSEGYCGMDCGLATSCDMFCEQGCELFCPSQTSCMVSCGAECNVVCEPESYCLVDPIDGPTTIVCLEGAICECTDPQLCLCEGPGCAPSMGP